MFKKWASWILTAITVIIFGLSIYIIIGSSIAHQRQELFDILGYSYAVVPTSSMEGDKEDNFKAGSVVVIYQKPFEDLEINDIIVFKSLYENKLIIHRIIQKTESGFITKGDNNPVADQGFVTKSNYQGTYVSHFEFLGIGLWISDLRTIILGFALLGLVGLVIYQGVKLMIMVRKTEDETDSNENEE